MALAKTESDSRKAFRALAALTLALGLLVVPADAESNSVVSPPQAAAPTGTAAADPMDASLSPECRVPGSKLYTLAKLKAVKEALKEKRPIRVLSVGSSSAGMGASASYPVKLESALERSLPNVDIEVESRGLSGEIASGAAERLRSMIAEVEPDLVVWQVGAADALARVDVESFGEALNDAVKYVKSHDIDIVLIDPLFTRSMAQDEDYNDLVQKVQEVAKLEGVPLVRRYEAMRFLSSSGDKGEAHMLGQQFRLNDLGLRCMAEHVTRAITLSLLQPDAAPAPRPAFQAEKPPAPPGEGSEAPRK